MRKSYMFKVMGCSAGASAMFKVMGGVRGVKHFQGDGRERGASAIHKVMRGVEERQPCSR